MSLILFVSREHKCGVWINPIHVACVWPAHDRDDCTEVCFSDGTSTMVAGVADEVAARLQDYVAKCERKEG